MPRRRCRLGHHPPSIIIRHAAGDDVISVVEHMLCRDYAAGRCQHEFGRETLAGRRFSHANVSYCRKYHMTQEQLMDSMRANDTEHFREVFESIMMNGAGPSEPVRQPAPLQQQLQSPTPAADVAAIDNASGSAAVPDSRVVDLARFWLMPTFMNTDERNREWLLNAMREIMAVQEHVHQQGYDTTRRLVEIMEMQR